MLGFLIGMAVGGLIGVIVMALLNAASRADDSMERYQRRKDSTSV
ncbi:DUF3789 domain-containing protein [Ruminococcus sp.]